MEQSIFELIRDAVTEDGRLPADFSLPDEKPQEQVKFASGAMDGILFYHTACQESEESEGYPLLIKAIERAAAVKFDAAMARPDLEAQDYVVLLNLKDYIKGADPDSASALGAGLIAFLHSDKVRSTVLSARKQDEALEIARRLGIEYQECKEL